MKKGLIILTVVGVVVLLVLGFFVLTNKAGDKTENQNSTQIFDCGKMQNPTCFINHMGECLPVTTELTATDGSSIDITILGIENDKCHFQRKVNNVLNLECYFPLGNLTWDLIDQTFGNNKGLQKVVDDSCKPAR